MSKLRQREAGRNSMIPKVFGHKDRTRVGFADFATLIKVKIEPKQYQYYCQERVELGSISFLSVFSEALAPRTCK